LRLSHSEGFVIGHHPRHHRDAFGLQDLARDAQLYRLLKSPRHQCVSAHDIAIHVFALEHEDGYVGLGQAGGQCASTDAATDDDDFRVHGGSLHDPI